jgi:predicted MPP superfamily phosphohydrolase
MQLYAKAFTKSSVKNKYKWLNELIFNDDYFNIDDFGNDTVRTVNSEKLFYGQKIKIPENSDIIVMSDLHGSLHSLLRNLWRLVMAGFINKDFKIVNPNIIFTGDFVDRGRYSIEVLYTIIRLKLANFDNVYMLRGNHENQCISEQYGLLDELKLKYDNQSRRVFNDISNFYRFLPVGSFCRS